MLWINQAANEKKYGQVNSKFYNRSMKSWVQDKDEKIYSTHIEEKSCC